MKVEEAPNVDLTAASAATREPISRAAPMREQVARITDPEAWGWRDGINRLDNPEAADRGRRAAGMHDRDQLVAPSLAKADAILALSPAWQPISSAPAKPGSYINVRSVTTYRWLAYKPDGKRQMGKAGRWQVAVGEYGRWTNAELPHGGEWQPNDPLPPPPASCGEGI